MPKQKLTEFQIVFEGAQRIMERHGLDFRAPWQCSLDDSEKDRYEALRDVVAFVQAETKN